MANSKFWFTPRSYLHFDPPVSKIVAEEIVENPSKVAKHSFYPFISFEIKSEKIVKDSKSKKISRKPKIRPIAYASHLDSQIYSYYNQKLVDLYERKLIENGLEKNVLAFRKLHKSNIDFAKEVFFQINKMDNCYVIASDIQKFFDNVDHEILKREWCGLLGEKRLPADHFAIFKSLTKHSKVDKRELFQTFGLSLKNPHGCSRKVRICQPEEFRIRVRKAGLIKSNQFNYGIPQGSPLSALLSNIYLLGFDKLIATEVSKVKGHYFRYCDDIFIIIPNNSDYFVNLITNTLKNDFKLSIHPEKTEVCRFYKEGAKQRSEKPIQYLGFIFDGEKILLRSAALAKFSSKMKKSVWVAKASMRKINSIRIKRGEQPRKIYLKKLYQKFSYLGKRNFISYGLKASRIMKSSSIRKQLKPLWSKFQKEIDQKMV